MKAIRADRILMAAGLVMLVVLRAGFRPSDGILAYVKTAKSFPDYVDGFMTTSLLHPLFGGMLGLSSRIAWMAGFLVVGVVVYAILWRTLGSKSDSGRTAFLLLLFSQIGTSMLIQVGTYDTLLIFGTVLVVASRSWLLQLAGVMVMVGANVELAVASLVCLALVSSVAETTIRPRRILLLGAGSALVWTAYAYWLFGSKMISDGRTGFFFDQLKSSVILNTRTIPLMIFSFYGICWLPVLAIIRHVTRPGQRFVLIAALILIPASLTFLTLDGTRVFVSLSAASLIAVMLAYKDELAERFPAYFQPKAVVLAALLIPSVWSFLGDIRAPYGYLYELIYDR